MKALALDLMGVVFQPGRMVKNRLYSMLPIRPPFDEVKAEYEKLVLGASEEDFWRYLGVGLELRQRFLDSLELDAEAKPLMAAARRKGVRVCALSNHAESWAEYLDEKFGLEWDYRFISAEKGVKKPHPETFERFLKETNLDAADVLFVDDQVRNLKAAQEKGFNCVWRETTEILQEPFAPAVERLSEVARML